MKKSYNFVEEEVVFAGITFIISPSVTFNEDSESVVDKEDDALIVNYDIRRTGSNSRPSAFLLGNSIAELWIKDFDEFLKQK